MGKPLGVGIGLDCKPALPPNLRVGVIGCGDISKVYFENLKNTYRTVEVVACSDILTSRAHEAAKRFGIPRVLTPEKLLSDPDIEMVINLTNPDQHAAINLAAIHSGKHVYSEKPLAVERLDGQNIINSAIESGLSVGCAPDTVLGAGIQTCRKIIDDGRIGTPIGATAFMVNHGHEAWHPSPEFFYQKGGGPMFDMGPYYLSALITLIGRIHRVTGSHRRSFNQRVITSKPRYGDRIEVQVSTHIAGILDFDSGAIGTIITSFDVWGSNLPTIEIYGTEGSLSVPDPNTFGGPVRIKETNSNTWADVPLAYVDGSRGLGVAEMAWAIRDNNRQPRASGQLANHVLDVMHAIHEASSKSEHITIQTPCDRPIALPIGLPEEIFE